MTVNSLFVLGQETPGMKDGQLNGMKDGIASGIKAQPHLIPVNFAYNTHIPDPALIGSGSFGEKDLNMSIELAKHELFVIQPTTLCNLNCGYCWCPERHVNQKMSNEMFVMVMERIAEQSSHLAQSASLCWHGSEPLMMGVSYYLQCLEDMKRIEDVYEFHLNAGIQTNATLINDKWIKMFKDYDLRLGVSVDGPAWLHDQKRVYRKNGNGTHADVERGMNMLSDAGIDFSVITVLTDTSLDHADEIYEYLSGLKTRGGFGFNIDEDDGCNKHSSILSLSADQGLMYERIKRFFHRILELNEASNRKMDLRDFSQYYDFIDKKQILGNNAPFNSMVIPGAIVNFDCHGNFSTFCPELLMGFPQEGNPFVFGNVTQDKIDSMPQNGQFKKAASEVLNGREQCLSECPYFCVCGAGSPSNRYAEYKTLNATGTLYCRNHVQAPADAVMDYIDGIRVGPVRGNIQGDQRFSSLVAS